MQSNPKPTEEIITFIRFDRNPLTDITTKIPMNKRDIYCTQKQQKQIETSNKCRQQDDISQAVGNT